MAQQPNVDAVEQANASVQARDAGCWRHYLLVDGILTIYIRRNHGVSTCCMIMHVLL